MTNFYESAAEIIPLLLLAAAVETRWLQNLRPLDEKPLPLWKARIDAVGLPLAVLLILAGELAALHAIATGDPSELHERITMLALLTTCFGVFTPILNAVVLTTSAALEPYRESRLGRTTGFVAIRVVHATVGLAAVAVVFGWIG